MLGMKLRPGVTVEKGKAQPNRPTVCRVEATPPRRNLPVLWRICTRCDQTGIDKLRGLPQRCPDCGGKAIILTEDGKAILELLEVEESHSPVTDEAVQEAIEKQQAEIKERARRQEEERKAAEKREEERQKALEKLVKAGFSPDELLR